MVNRYLIHCALAVQFGAFFYGYDSGLLTSIIGFPSFIRYFNFDATTLGALGSCYYGGSFLGGIACMVLPNKIGRKPTIGIACVFAVVGATLQTGAVNLAMLYVGRSLGGVANGLVYAACPMFAAEIAPPEHRGKIGGLYSIYINLGYTLTEWMGVGFYWINQSTNTSWRVFLGLQLIFPFIMAYFLTILPESPRFLIMKGKESQALETLHKLHGGVDGDDSFAIREFNQIKAQLELEQRERLGVRSILKVWSYRRRALMMVFAITGIMFSGIIPLQNYQVVVYGKLGVTPFVSLVLAGVWGSVGCIFCVLGASLFDRLGRRKSLLISLFGQLIGQIIATAFWARFEASGEKDLAMGKGTVVGMFLYLASYAFIVNTWAYTYPSEISPLAIRAFIVGAASVTFNAITIMQVQVTPIAIQNISWRYELIFVICIAIFIVGIYLWFPETKGKTLEEIAGLFGDKVATHIDDESLENIDEQLAAAAHVHATHGMHHTLNEKEKADADMGVVHEEKVPSDLPSRV